MMVNVGVIASTTIVGGIIYIAADKGKMKDGEKFGYGALFGGFAGLFLIIANMGLQAAINPPRDPPVLQANPLRGIPTQNMGYY